MGEKGKKGECKKRERKKGECRGRNNRDKIIKCTRTNRREMGRIIRGNWG